MQLRLGGEWLGWTLNSWCDANRLWNYCGNIINHRKSLDGSKPERWYEYYTTGSCFFFACSINYHGFSCPGHFFFRFESSLLTVLPLRLFEVSEKLAPTRWANVQGDGDWNHGWNPVSPRWSFVRSRLRALRRLQGATSRCYVIFVGGGFFS